MKRSLSRLSALAFVMCAGAVSYGIAPMQPAAQPAGQPAAQPVVKPLAVGDPAPALKVGKWLKGDEVKQFEAGKVYVVEMWATWCGPCKVSIPHLTELANKNKGKATFIGVSVWENRVPLASESAYTERAQEFVDKMGDKMNYTVVMDDRPLIKVGSTALNWLDAAGREGIPSAFIVNGEGKIAWVGHPMFGLSEALDQVLAGTWDMNKATADFKKELAETAARHAEEDKIAADMKPAIDALKAKDIQKASQLMDEAIKKHPDRTAGLKMGKFMRFLGVDEPIAYAAARDVMENDGKNDPGALNQIAWTILSSKSLKTPDYDLALQAAQRAVEVTNSADGSIMDSLAFAQFKKGMIDEAIQTQTKAIELAKGMKESDAGMIKEMEARLEEIKKAKK